MGATPPMNKSCLTCPSMLDATEATNFFGGGTSGPMCARFGTPLGSSTTTPVTTKMIADKVGAGCDSHGKPKPIGAPEYLKTQTMVPHISALTRPEQDDDEENRSAVYSCRDCVFYIQPGLMAQKFGWSAGGCGKTGRLLLQNRLATEAKACDVKVLGSHVVADTDNMHLLPLYNEAFTYDPSPLGRWKKNRENGNSFEPSTYAGDAKVSAEEAKSGIRAWREVIDPSGSGHTVMLPIFDADFFSDDERSKIPQTGDDEHPEDYIDGDNYVYSVGVEWMCLDETPALWGQPGVGKTELARHLAWMMQLPFDRFSITKSTEIEDLAGKMLFINGETRFQEGRLPLRWRKPGVLLIDEPNAGPDDVWQFIRPLTDNSKQLVLDMAGAQKVIRNDYCFLLMAMNPAWDFKNTGVQELADADTNRLAHVYMELPDRATEEVILRTRCEKDGWTPDNNTMTKVLDIADEIRALVADGSLPTTWGIRPNIKVIRHLRWFSPAVAYRRAVADFLEPDIAKMILSVVEAKGL